MRILLDTNIIIHREASRVINQDIGQLINWLDRLKYTKCVHPATAKELEKHRDSVTVESMKLKLSSYNILKTKAPLDDRVKSIIDYQDKTDNSKIDSLLLNEVINRRVDLLITNTANYMVSLGNQDR